MDASSSGIARLQQAIALGGLGLAFLAVWVLWPLSVLGACAAGAAIVSGHAGVLALEFGLLGWVAAADPAPRPTGWQLLQAWAREVVQGWRVFAWRQPFRWRAIPDHYMGQGMHGQRGVVLVHGFVCNRGFWLPWLRRLKAQGHPFVAVNLGPPFTSIDHLVPALDEAVGRIRAATGLPPLVVAHSMGGLVVRAWVRACRASGAEPDTQVHQVITIGSPHAGTWLARWSLAPNARQMRLGSAWLAHLQSDWEACRRSGLAERYTCWYSNADNIVMPPSTARLAGADNRFLPGVAHVDLAFQPAVIEDALRHLTPRSAMGRQAAGRAGG